MKLLINLSRVAINHKVKWFDIQYNVECRKFQFTRGEGTKIFPKWD